MNNLSLWITSLAGLLTTVSGIVYGAASFRKTRAEAALLERGEQPAPATSPRDSETKLFTLVTTQLETTYGMLTQTQHELEECRNRRRGSRVQ